MPYDLHPDKLVGAARALNKSKPSSGVNTNRPVPRPPINPTRDVGFQPRASAAFTPNEKAKRVNQAPGLLEQMAFAMRDRHWNEHLNRLFNRPQAPGIGDNKTTRSGGPGIGQSRPAPQPGLLSGKPGSRKPPIPFINLQIGHPERRQ